jgi:hypothetical protein
MSTAIFALTFGWLIKRSYTRYRTCLITSKEYHATRYAQGRYRTAALGIRSH